MRAVAVIPARYASTRFPGKPLAIINGKPMIRRVYEQCLKSKEIDETIVATDDIRIYECVKSFGGNAVMTSVKHKSGTDRIAEAVRNKKCDIVVNVQGDEPYVSPSNINKLVKSLSNDRKLKAATLAVRFRDAEEADDENKVKVVTSLKGDAIYFSRKRIPFSFGAGYKYLKHLGIYGFRKSFLYEFTGLRHGPLEKSERLEQLRILENGYRISVLITDKDSVSVDTPEDLIRLGR